MLEKAKGEAQAWEEHKRQRERLTPSIACDDGCETELAIAAKLARLMVDCP